MLLNQGRGGWEFATVSPVLMRASRLSWIEWGLRLAVTMAE